MTYMAPDKHLLPVEPGNNKYLCGLVVNHSGADFYYLSHLTAETPGLCVDCKARAPLGLLGSTEL